MKICLLTYDTPHRKTAQVFMGLHNRGIREIDFLLMPFSRRPERAVLLQHRPYQFEGPDPRSLAALSNSNVRNYRDWRAALHQYDYFLVCGSNLIEPEFANSGKVLNVHSGLIPSVRGLDSFKWAIHRSLPLGNTLHCIDSEADAGRVLAHRETPVFLEDDLQTIATRHYETEIWMLTNFDRLLEEPVMQLEMNDPTKRMSIETEALMVQRFETYKTSFAVGSKKT